MRVFHYTIRNYLESILTKGLRVATAGVPDGVRPAVWFSTEPFWEPTANKGGRMVGNRFVPGDRVDTERLGGGLMRIEVTPEIAPYRFCDYREMTGDPMTAGLRAAARAVGANPGNWRYSFDPIPPEKFIGVEVLVDWRWVSLTPQEKRDDSK